MKEESLKYIKTYGLLTGTTAFGLPAKDIDYVLTIEEANRNNIIDTGYALDCSVYPESEFIAGNFKKEIGGVKYDIILVDNEEVKDYWRFATFAMQSLVLDEKFKSLISNSRSFKVNTFYNLLTCAKKTFKKQVSMIDDIPF